MNGRLVWAILTISLVCSACAGRGKDADLPSPYRRLAVPETLLASEAARARGGVLFLRDCAICHGVRGDGHGIRHEGIGQPRDFTNPAWQAATSPRHIFFAIREGIRGTAMPSWTTLDDRQTWDLVAYILSLGGH